ncbi:MAG: hypothetical protein R3B84_08135 [Zavarzinella sp.]
MPLTLRPPAYKSASTLEHVFAPLIFRWRWVTLIRGLSGLILIVAIFLTITSSLDYFFALPSLVRAGILIICIVSSFRWIYRAILKPWKITKSHEKLAEQIELRFPVFEDSLRSAVGLMQTPLPNDAFTRATIRKAIRRAERYDLAEVVPSRYLLRLFLLAFAACIIFLLLLGIKSQLVTNSLQRFFLPYHHQIVDQRVFIKVISPESFPVRIARGDSLELELELSGNIPSTISVNLQYASGYISTANFPVPSEPKTRFSVRLDSSRLQQDAQLTIQANDTSFLVGKVQVAIPPKLVPLNQRPSPQITLEYPTYTDLAKLALQDGTSVVELFPGTHLNLVAAVDRPIKRAWLELDHDAPAIMASTISQALPISSQAALTGYLANNCALQSVPLQLSDDRQIMQIRWAPLVAGNYILRFEDDSGVAGSRLLEVNIIPDPLPAIEIVDPPPGVDLFALLPTAPWNYEISVDDPVFAIARVLLEYQINAEPTKRLPIMDADQIRLVTDQIAIAPLPYHRGIGIRNYRYQGQFELASLRKQDNQTLSAGDLVRMRFLATDFNYVDCFRQPGFSREIAIRIVTAGQLRTSLDEQLAKIREEILEIFQLQTRTIEMRERVHDRRDFSNTTIPAVDSAAANEVGLQQKSIHTRIQHPNDGIIKRLLDIETTINQNRLATTDTVQRLRFTITELKRLENQIFDPLSERLEEWRSIKQQNRYQTVYQTILGQQQENWETLKNLTELLEPRNSTTKLSAEARTIIQKVDQLSDQLKLQQTTVPQNMKPETLTDDQKKLLEKSAADSATIAESVRLLTEQLYQLTEERSVRLRELNLAQKDIETKLAKLDTQNKISPPAVTAEKKRLQAELLDLQELKAEVQAEKDALQRAIDGGNVENLKKVSQAATAHLQKADTTLGQQENARTKQRLQELLENLQPQAQDQPDLLVKKLRQQNQTFNEVFDKQDEILKATQEANRLNDPTERAEALQKLAKQQAELEAQLDHIAERLEREQNDVAANQLRQASRMVQEATEAMQRGDDATAQQNKVLDKIDQAQEQMNNAKDEQREELQREKQQELISRLQALRDRQERAIAEMTRLHQQAIGANKWDRSLRVSLVDLQKEETAVSSAIQLTQNEDFKEVPVFHRMLQQAVGALELIDRRLFLRLDIAELGPFDLQTEELLQAGILSQQELVKMRLVQLMTALKDQQEQKQKAAVAKTEAKDQPKPPPQTTGNQLPPLAELKALKELQTDIAHRTKLFAEKHPAMAELNDDEQLELQLLEQMQRDIAELIQKAVKSPEEPMPEIPE